MYNLISNIEDLEMSENSNCSYSFIDSFQLDMDVHEELKKTTKLSKQKEKVRIILLK